MAEPVPKDEDLGEAVSEFICGRCGATDYLPLAAVDHVPRCRCGSPLSAGIAADSGYRYEGLCLVEGRAGYPDESRDGPEYVPLDHPHTEPHCEFCAARQQRPNLHRLWCAVFFLRECNCGYAPA
ncbi:MAG TPA: hypothetical protein VGT40_00085 [Methylomirabilota bacterium]|nr:hypothetical protein [Methylomirabilota bacterium]